MKPKRSPAFARLDYADGDWDIIDTGTADCFLWRVPKDGSDWLISDNNMTVEGDPDASIWTAGVYDTEGNVDMTENVTLAEAVAWMQKRLGSCEACREHPATETVHTFPRHPSEGPGGVSVCAQCAHEIAHGERDI